MAKDRFTSIYHNDAHENTHCRTGLFSSSNTKTSPAINLAYPTPQSSQSPSPSKLLNILSLSSTLSNFLSNLPLLLRNSCQAPTSSGQRHSDQGRPQFSLGNLSTRLCTRLRAGLSADTLLQSSGKCWSLIDCSLLICVGVGGGVKEIVFDSSCSSVSSSPRSSTSSPSSSSSSSSSTSSKRSPNAGNAGGMRAP